MRIGKTYSHLNGHEWLLVHRKSLWDEILGVIESIDTSKYKTKISKEKTMRGKKLYAPIELNNRFKAEFDKKQWQEERTTYWVTDDHELIRRTMHMSAEEQKEEYEKEGKEAIFSYNQTDFVKNRVAVEIQFGKYAFIPFDLFVKHLAFYIGNTIDVGIEIVPMKSMQLEMSSGPGYFEGALYDLVRQGRGSPPVPLVLVGIQP